MTINIMVIDDHAIVLHGLSQLINAEPDLKVTLTAESAEAALEVLKNNALPDMVVCDISLPGISGIELTKTITTLHPTLKVLVLSMHDELLHGERAFRAGAKGYLTKHEATEKVITAIRKIMEGGVYVNERMQSILEKNVRISPKNKVASALSRLTDREYEIFRMVGRGLKSSEIAVKLERSIKTIDAHRNNIKHKLGLQSATALHQFAATWADRERV